MCVYRYPLYLSIIHTHRANLVCIWLFIYTWWPNEVANYKAECMTSYTNKIVSKLKSNTYSIWKIHCLLKIIYLGKERPNFIKLFSSRKGYCWRYLLAWIIAPLNSELHCTVFELMHIWLGNFVDIVGDPQDYQEEGWFCNTNYSAVTSATFMADNIFIITSRSSTLIQNQ